MSGDKKCSPIDSVDFSQSKQILDYKIKQRTKKQRMAKWKKCLSIMQNGKICEFNKLLLLL